MKILALERELSEAADAEGKSLLKSEAARVWELYQAGVVREIYFDQEHPHCRFDFGMFGR